MEKLGRNIPFDVRCFDERGKESFLNPLIDRPTVLSLVYYTCEHICPQLLGGLAQLISELDLDPQRDYRVITLSFDSNDTPHDAAVAKRNFVKPLGPRYPDKTWRFLTAPREDIRKLTKSLGFRFRKEDHGFTHPVILVILAPGGKISRYICASKYQYGVGYPITFSKVDLTESLRAAGRWKTLASPAQPLLFCFPHEPAGRERFFTLIRVLGWGTLVGMGVLFIYLAAGRKRPKEGR